MNRHIVLFAALATVAFAGISTNVDWRIVGGQTAKDGQFPYQVSLRIFGRHTCGASILNEEWILTAAHCVYDSDATDFSIVAGSNQLNSGGDTYPVIKSIVHKGFNMDTVHDDVALLKVNRKIEYNAKVQPIALNTDDIGGDEDLVLSGWGRTSYPGDIPNNLQFLPLKSVSLSECQEIHAGAGWTVEKTQICSFSQYGQGACHGDSGGPLVYKGKVAGLASWVVPCARGYPDVFTRVSEYVDWINQNMQ